MPQTRVRSVVASGVTVGLSVGRYVGCTLVGVAVSGIAGVGSDVGMLVGALLVRDSNVGLADC